MSLEENINYIKKEVSVEENFIENFFKFEKFYKKYKTFLLGATIIAIVSLIGFYATSFINTQNKLEANIAFNKLLVNPNDTTARAILKKKNIKLLQIIDYKNDYTKKIDNDFLKNISTYAKALKDNNIDELSASTLQQTFILKDFALINKTIMQISKNEYINAKETVKLISNSSTVSSVKLMLEHFLLTK